MSKKRSSRGMRRMRMRPPGALGRRRPGGVLVRARAALLSFLLVRPQGTRSRRAGRSRSAGALPRGSPGPRLAPVSAIDPRHVLALDQGTSSSRAIVFDDRARPVAIAQYEVHSQFPHPGWVEQDAEALWAGQVRAGQQALAGAGLDAEEVAAVGITNQRETTVVWDGTGRPLAPAIVWQDRRTAERCAALRAGGVEPAVRARPGLPLVARAAGALRGAGGRAPRGPGQRRRLRDDRAGAVRRTDPHPGHGRGPAGGPPRAAPPPPPPGPEQPRGRPLPPPRAPQGRGR